MEILAPPEGAVPGDLVTVAGFEGKPDDVIKPTNKKAVSVFEQVAPDLKTNESCEATYKVLNYSDHYIYMKFTVETILINEYNF